MSITFGVITDVHYNNGTAQELWGSGPVLDEQYRQYSTADDRLKEFLEEIETQSADFGIQLGDLVDDGTGNRATDLAAAINRYDTDYSNSVWNVLGNHEASLYDGSGGNAFSDYWTTMDTAANVGSRENEWDPDGDGTAAYTFEEGGVRFVVLYATGIGDAQSPGAVDIDTWLSTVALDTTNPVVVFTHGSLVDTGYEYGHVDNYATIRGLLETAGNVQLVVQGHFHRNQISDWVVPYQTINDILYFSCRGSVLGSDDGDSSDTATITDSAYYLFNITPNAIKGTNQQRANVAVTAYEKGVGKLIDRFVVA